MLGHVVLALALGFLSPALARVSYRGDEVLRIIPTSDDHVVALRNLADEKMYDVWQEPRKPNVPVDIRCDSHPGLRSCENLKSFLKENNMKYNIMIDNIEKLVSFPTSNEYNASTYNSYSVTSDWIQSLANTFPDICELVEIGTSYEGRAITGIRITGSKNKGDDKPGFWLDGGLHAREWITTAVVSYMLDEALLAYSNGDAEIINIVDNLDLLFAPILNPDGYDYTFTDDRMWRKTRMPNDHSPCYGTDPNRNWDFHWGEAGQSTHPCSDSYSGASAANQPEIIAVQDYIRNDNNFKGYINFHSYSQLWMSPWGYTSDLPVDYDAQNAGSEAAVEALESVHGTKYEYGPISTTIYPASGSSCDYTYGVCNVTYSYGVELRDTGEYGFLLPEDEILPSGEETWAGVIALAKVIIDSQ
jgi:murein tripeptide amidase MpaA